MKVNKSYEKEEKKKNQITINVCSGTRFIQKKKREIVQFIDHFQNGRLTSKFRYHFILT